MSCQGTSKKFRGVSYCTYKEYSDDLEGYVRGFEAFGVKSRPGRIPRENLMKLTPRDRKIWLDIAKLEGMLQTDDYIYQMSRIGNLPQEGGKCHRCGKYVSGPKKGRRYTKHCSSTGKYKRTSKNKSLKRVGKPYKSSRKSSLCKRRKTRSDKGRTHRRRSTSHTKKRKTRSDKGRTHRRRSTSHTKKRKTRSDKGRTHRRRAKSSSEPKKKRKTRSDKGRSHRRRAVTPSSALALVPTPSTPSTPSSPLDAIKDFFVPDDQRMEHPIDKERPDSQRLSHPKRPSGPKGRKPPTRASSTKDIVLFNDRRRVDESDKARKARDLFISRTRVDDSDKPQKEPQSVLARLSDAVSDFFAPTEPAREEPWLNANECPDIDYPVRCKNKNWCVPPWWNEMDDKNKYRPDEFCHRTKGDILQRMGSTDELKKLYKNQRKAYKKPIRK